VLNSGLWTPHEIAFTYNPNKVTAGYDWYGANPVFNKPLCNLSDIGIRIDGDYVSGHDIACMHHSTILSYSITCSFD